MSTDPLDALLGENQGLTREDELEATEVDKDLMVMLARLEELAARRRKDPAIEAEYERLRNACQAVLAESGPRWFLDENHHKRIASRVAPMQIDVDVEELVRQVSEGETHLDIDKVAPRKIDKEELKKAVAKGQIAPASFLKMATLREGTAHVRFSEPDDDG